MQSVEFNVRLKCGVKDEIKSVEFNVGLKCGVKYENTKYRV